MGVTDRELIVHVARTTGMDTATAARVVADVRLAQSETVAEFVRRRHRELQAEGLANVEIYPVLRDEVLTRRFAAGEMSERQLRRLVYG